MDTSRIDRLTRLMALPAQSRRKLVLAVIGAAIGSVTIPGLRWHAAASAKCPNGKHKCHGHCCPARGPVCCKGYCCKKGYKCCGNNKCCR